MKYVQGFDGDRIRPKMKGWKQRCCDCGLTHVFKFYIVRNQFGVPVVEFESVRDQQATARVRRRKRAAK